MKFIHPLLRGETVPFINQQIKQIAETTDPFTNEDIKEFIATKPEYVGCKYNKSEAAAFSLFVYEKIKSLDVLADTKVAGQWAIHMAFLYRPSVVEKEIIGFMNDLENVTDATCSVCQDHIHVDFGQTCWNEGANRGNAPPGFRLEIVDDGRDRVDDAMTSEIAVRVALFYAKRNFAAAKASRMTLAKLGINPDRI